MTTEKESSSPSQKPSMLHGLLGILFSVSAFGVWLWSRKRSTEQHESQDTALPQDTANDTTQSRANLSPSTLRVVIDSAPPTPTPNKERETREEGKDRRDKKRFGIEIVVAILILLYTSFAGWQGCEMRKATIAAKEAADTSRESLTSVQRAFLILSNLNAVPNVHKSTDDKLHLWNVNPIWTNAGTTPAIRVFQHFAGEISADEPSNERFRGHGVDQTYTSSYMGPKVSQGGGPIAKPDDFFNFKEMPTDDQRRYLWGWVAYNDIFPKTRIHITEFCEYLSGERKQPDGVIVAFGYNTCKHHNCADEDCEDYNDIVSLIPTRN